MIDLTGIEMLETRTENGQGRCGKFAFWTVERAWDFECCGITIHGHLSGSYGPSTRTGVFVAAVIIRSHCGDRQKQAGDGLTKVRRRGSSTVKLSGTKALALETQPVVLSNIQKEAPAAGLGCDSAVIQMMTEGDHHDIAIWTAAHRGVYPTSKLDLIPEFIDFYDVLKV